MPIGNMSTAAPNNTFPNYTSAVSFSNSTPRINLIPSSGKAIASLFYGAIIVLAIGGNLIICLIILTQKRMRTVTNFFIASLACSDALMAILCIPFTFVANVLFHFWPFGSALCPVVLYSQVASVFLSAFTMLAISLDRYRAVLFPLKPRLTKRSTMLIISLTWFLALTVSFPVAYFSKMRLRVIDRYGNTRHFCEEDWQEYIELRFFYSLAVMILQYFLPLSILTFTYTSIGIVIWVKKIPGEAQNNRDQRVAASKRKMVRMMITVVVIYALCWLPLHTITLLGETHPDVWRYRYIQIIWTVCHWLAMSNCCYNPIIYFCMNAKFRNGFLVVCRCCPLVKRRGDSNFLMTSMAPSKTAQTNIVSTTDYCDVGRPTSPAAAVVEVTDVFASATDRHLRSRAPSSPQNKHDDDTESLTAIKRGSPNGDEAKDSIHRLEVGAWK